MESAEPRPGVRRPEKNLNSADDSGLARVMDLEAEHMVRTMMTDDHARAAQAFVEKRAPRFEGN